MNLSPPLVTALFAFAATALLTSIASVFKLTFQHGGTLEKLTHLIDAVRSLTERMEEMSESHGAKLGGHDQQFARMEERVGQLATRVLNLETNRSQYPV